MSAEWNGFPENPERDGVHWVCGTHPHEKPHPEFWKRNQSGFSWWSKAQWSASTAAKYWRYLGPCHTPAEVAALTAAAEMRGRTAIIDALGPIVGITNMHVEASEAIASLPPPSGASALAAMLDQARREALEEAAKIAEWGHMVPPDGGSPTEAEYEVARSIAAAIRARKEPRDAE